MSKEELSTKFAIFCVWEKLIAGTGSVSLTNGVTPRTRRHTIHGHLLTLKSELGFNGRRLLNTT